MYHHQDLRARSQPSFPFDDPFPAGLTTDQRPLDRSSRRPRPQHIHSTNLTFGLGFRLIHPT